MSDGIFTSMGERGVPGFMVIVRSSYALKHPFRVVPGPPGLMQYGVPLGQEPGNEQT